MNKSAGYQLISIKVTSIKGNTVRYELAHAKSRTFSWSATLGRDRMTVSQLEVGQKYWIRTMSDEFGTQHWDNQTPLSQPKPSVDAITKKVTATHTKREVNPDLLFF